jgi:8-oxo-dGTP diphosphatase
MNEPIPAVGVLIAEHGRVLLVKHKEGSQHVVGIYGFPAGRIEPNESEKQAAIRELFEETGLKTTEEDLYDYQSNHFPSIEIPRKNGKTETFNYKIFVCRKYSGNLKESAETTPEWVEITKLSDYYLLPKVKEVVEREVRW